MIWVAVLAYVASAVLAAWLGGRLDRRPGAETAPSGRPSTALGMWMAFAQVIALPFVALYLASAPAQGADLDPYACFGGARYVAMGAGFQCADLPAFCADARALLEEAGGDEVGAERLARSRGHSRLAVALAHRFCTRRG